MTSNFTAKFRLFKKRNKKNDIYWLTQTILDFKLTIQIYVVALVSCDKLLIFEELHDVSRGNYLNKVSPDPVFTLHT